MRNLYTGQRGDIKSNNLIFQNLECRSVTLTEIDTEPEMIAYLKDNNINTSVQLQCLAENIDFRLPNGDGVICNDEESQSCQRNTVMDRLSFKDIPPRNTELKNIPGKTPKEVIAQVMVPKLMAGLQDHYVPHVYVENYRKVVMNQYARLNDAQKSNIEILNLPRVAINDAKSDISEIIYEKSSTDNLVPFEDIIHPENTTMGQVLHRFIITMSSDGNVLLYDLFSADGPVLIKDVEDGMPNLNLDSDLRKSISEIIISRPIHQKFSVEESSGDSGWSDMLGVIDFTTSDPMSLTFQSLNDDNVDSTERLTVDQAKGFCRGGNLRLRGYPREISFTVKNKDELKTGIYRDKYGNRINLNERSKITIDISYNTENPLRIDFSPIGVNREVKFDVGHVNWQISDVRKNIRIYKEYNAEDLDTLEKENIDKYLTSSNRVEELFGFKQGEVVLDLFINEEYKIQGTGGTNNSINRRALKMPGISVMGSHEALHNIDYVLGSPMSSNNSEWVDFYSLEGNKYFLQLISEQYAFIDIGYGGHAGTNEREFFASLLNSVIIDPENEKLDRWSEDPFSQYVDTYICSLSVVLKMIRQSKGYVQHKQKQGISGGLPIEKLIELKITALHNIKENL